MVSVDISKLGCTDPVFVDPGVKINGAYYPDVLLSKQLLPVMREVTGEFFVFQQDNVPAHRAYSASPDPQLVGRGFAAPSQEPYPRLGPSSSSL